MSLDATRAANALVTDYEASSGITLTPAQRVAMKAAWASFIGSIFNEIKTNGAINMPVQAVDPGSFSVSSTPVTGAGSVAAQTLTGKIS